jgi:hypothetical protein
MLLGAFALFGCRSSDVLGPAAIAGEYELTRIGATPLPANPSGRVTVLSGHLSLAADGRYTRSTLAETCVPAGVDCTTGTRVDRGTWIVQRDGTLYLDSEQGYSWPAQPIEADGRQVRFYILGDGELAEVYDRR